MNLFRSMPITALLFFAIALFSTIPGISVQSVQSRAKAESSIHDPHVEIQGWTQTASLPEALSLRNAVQIGEFVYVIGGRNGAGNPIDNVHSARDKGRWITRAVAGDPRVAR